MKIEITNQENIKIIETLLKTGKYNIYEFSNNEKEEINILLFSKTNENNIILTIKYNSIKINEIIKLMIKYNLIDNKIRKLIKNYNEIEIKELIKLFY